MVDNKFYFLITLKLFFSILNFITKILNIEIYLLKYWLSIR